MACPKCGCKVTYTYDDDDVMPTPGYERCAACGEIFDELDAADDDDYFDE